MSEELKAAKIQTLRNDLQDRGLLEYVERECQASGLTLLEFLESRSPPAPECRRRVYTWLRDEKGFSAVRISALFGKSRSGVTWSLQQGQGAEQ